MTDKENAYKATLYIKTNYDIEGVKCVLEKLLSIPLLQYTDCEKWNFKIGIESMNANNIIWEEMRNDR